ncbi:MAG: hypothetical protein ABID61_04950, partial [Candidatus Micrarchaeota archaeon]
IDVLNRKQTIEETLNTPIGVCAVLAGTAENLIKNEETMKQIHGMFLPTGYLRRYLRITIEGDPDAGLGSMANEVLLTGYRYGLDDVIIDGKLIDSTHGNKAEIIKNYADYLENNSWCADKDKKLEQKMKRTAKTLRNIAEQLTY